MPFISTVSRKFAFGRNSAYYKSLKLEHTLDNPNAYDTSAGDGFGSPAAVSGNYAIVGAGNEDDAGGTSSGKAYIFNVTDGSLVHTLDNPNAYGTSASDIFGVSVAISGNRAIVGASGDGDIGGNFSGKAYIFDVSSGSLLYTLDNPNAYDISAGDRFGASVAISGDRAIVGAYLEDDAGGTSSGKAYIFNVTTGSLVHTLDNPNTFGTSELDWFGAAVAISGNYAIVGARNEDDAGGNFSGKAYIFNVTTGSLVHTLDNPNGYDTSAGDEFGKSVAISGNYAIVGVPDEDDAGGAQSGKAYIFDVSSGSLLYTLDNPNAYSTSASDLFGFSVDISGNYAIVSAIGEDDAGGISSGKAYIYDISTFATSTISSANYVLDNPNAYSTSAGDDFGRVVAISGNRAIVGAVNEDDAGGTSSGKAYIYKLSDSIQYQPQNLYTLYNPNAFGTSADDQFGSAIDISGDYAIVSAVDEDDAGGIDSGKAYIFNVTDGSLVHTLDNPNTYGTSQEDAFGISVAISGNYAIVGSSAEDDVGGISSGKVHVFNVTSGSRLRTLNNPNGYGTSENDFFGNKVAISGNYAIINAVGEDDAGGTDSGKVYIFDVTTGSLVHTLDNPNAYDTSYLDRFGHDVAISGDRAIVSALYEDDAVALSSGKAYIFDVTTGSLVHTLDNPNAYGTTAQDQFGNSVAISGDYAIVGTKLEDDASGTGSGKVYIYDVTSGNLLYTLNNPNNYGLSNDDVFGDSVSISGNYVIVGARLEDEAGGTSSGKAYIYNIDTFTTNTISSATYVLNNPNVYGTSQSDLFGGQVRISGKYVIVGADFEDDAGGDGSGAAYVFELP